MTKLAPLPNLKYRDSIPNAVADLGEPETISEAFSGFQKFLFEPAAWGDSPALGPHKSVIRIQIPAFFMMRWISYSALRGLRPQRAFASASLRKDSVATSQVTWRPSFMPIQAAAQACKLRAA